MGNALEASFVQANPSLVDCLPEIHRTVDLLAEVWGAGGQLLLCGNGGSASDADHIAGELLKGFLLPRPLPRALQQSLEKQGIPGAPSIGRALQSGLRAIPLTGFTAYHTAFANDVNGVWGFAQLVQVLGRPGDAVLGLTTSGNSENIVAALSVGRALGLHTLALTGAGRGRIRDWCDICISVPATNTAAVQEMHLPVYHLICALSEQRFFGPDRTPDHRGVN